MGNFMIFLGKHHELVSLPVSVYHQIGDDDGNQQHHETINQFLDIVEHKVGSTHNNDIGEQTDPPVRDIENNDSPLQCVR